MIEKKMDYDRKHKEYALRVNDAPTDAPTDLGVSGATPTTFKAWKAKV